MTRCPLRPRALARSVVTALAATLCVAPPAAAQLRLAEVGKFKQPVFVTGAPGDYSRLYVVEQDGMIRVVKDGATLTTPFVDMQAQVASPADGGGRTEQGLLSMAFSPDFQRSRLLYVYFTDLENNLRVEELRAQSPDLADPGYRRTVLEVPHPESDQHNGGQLQFGPDGLLYLGTGDGSRNYDEPVRDAQDPNSLLGKIIRLDPRASPVRPEVWSLGLRNPWRFSFDRATGDLTIGDAGANTIEEIDFVPASAGAGRGANFGWDECEGSLRSYPPPTANAPCHLSGDVRPLIEQRHSGGWCAIIGGYVVRDRSLPSLFGRYLYGDLCHNGLRSAVLQSSAAIDDRETLEFSSPSSFGEDTAGCIYAVTYWGDVYRLVETATGAPCPPPTPRSLGSTASSPILAPDGRAPSDRRAPRLRLRVPRRQHVLRTRGVVAYVSCDEQCTVSMSSRLRSGDHSYMLRPVRSPLAAGKRTKLRGHLTRRALRALQRQHRSTVGVAVRVWDISGNRSPLARHTVRVVR